ncbi:MAG: hypothetical protein CMH90_01085 [Oceanicaulis sp.]|nr:hypothetical protein [Oceanicaulis sp.]HCR65554.1 hypothetical protein [Oceanicaulis sp.]
MLHRGDSVAMCGAGRCDDGQMGGVGDERKPLVDQHVFTGMRAIGILFRAGVIGAMRGRNPS